MMQKTALFICLSESWGSTERRALQDSDAYNGKKSKGFLVCLKNTFVDIEAKKLNIPRIYFRSRNFDSPLSLNNIIEFSRIVKAHRAELIHAYDTVHLWSLSWVLRGQVLTPLFFSIFKEFKTPHTSLLSKLLLRRVDRFFTTTDELADNIFDSLPIKKNKVEVLGVGISELLEVDPEFSNKEGLQVKKGHYLIGTVVDCHIDDSEVVMPFFNMIAPLKAKFIEEGIKKKLDFVLLGEREWEKNLLYANCLREVERLGIADYVQFHFSSNIQMIQNDFDLWVGLEASETISDYILTSLAQGIPVVLPRTPSTSELLRQKEGMGETYHPRDPRELKENCFKVLTKLRTYKSKAMENSEFLYESYGVNKYFSNLRAAYKRAFQIRERYFKKGNLFFKRKNLVRK